MTDEKNTVAGHLLEARKRILTILAIWGFAFICIYIISPKLLKMIVDTGNALGIGLGMLSPVEVFFCEGRIAFALGFTAALPVITYETASYFMLPLKRRSIVFVTIVVLSGAALGLRVIMPAALKLFIIMAGRLGIAPYFTLDKAVSFTLSFALAGGLLALSVCLLAFLVNAGVLSGKTLSTMRPAAYIAVFLISAFITPPDVISMLFAALPLILVYEVCAGVARAKDRKDEGKIKLNIHTEVKTK